MAFKGRKSTNKNPPFFSHEFFIQNHADIVSCVALLFVVGLMIQGTTAYAYMFIALHHNVTDTLDRDVIFKYTYGLKDICVTFFYFLICIVIHAIIQEYILDKISRKLHLSKVKHSKFNESGQFLFFYTMSLLWGGHIILKENLLLNISSLWEGYPHTEMVFMFKFYFIIQLAYWLHTFPELYFQKVKREEMLEQIAYATVAFSFIFSAYIFNFTRVGVCLLVIHYLSEIVFHIARLIDFVDREEKGGKMGFNVWNAVFLLARLSTVMLAVLTFWFGLPSLEAQPGSEPISGDFNSPTVRIGALAAVVLLQVYLMFNFITDFLRQLRETQPSTVRRLPVKKPIITKKKEAVKKNKEYDELPEVDQNTKKNLKQKLKVK